MRQRWRIIMKWASVSALLALLAGCATTSPSAPRELVYAAPVDTTFRSAVELMMEQLAGKVPIELTGRVPFPAVGELPYFVTLPPHGFYWFELIDQVMDEGLGATAAGTDVSSVTSIRGVGRAW